MPPTALTCVLLVLVVLGATAAAWDAHSVEVYSAPREAGTLIRLYTNDSIDHFNATVGSVAVPPSVMLVLYSEPFFRGTRTFVVASSSDVHGLVVQSMQVLTIPAACALARTRATDVIAVYSYTWTATLDAVPIGHTVANLSVVMPAYLLALDAPPGVVVEASHHTNFTGYVFRWNASMGVNQVRAFRVRIDDGLHDVAQTPGVQPRVTLFASNYANADSLSVALGQQVTTIAYLAGYISLINAVEVPPGLRFLGYCQPGLRGARTNFGEGFYDNLSLYLFNSFQVVEAAAPVPPLSPPPDPATVVTCIRPFGANWTFDAGGRVPFFATNTCNALVVPPGLAVVGYDRPWYLGAATVATTSTLTDAANWAAWNTRWRSLQVVLSNDAALLSSPARPPPTVYAQAYMMGYYARYYIGDAVPGVAEWELPGRHFAFVLTIPPRVGLLLCDGYNFQGVCTMYRNSTPPTSSAGLSLAVTPTFKSYKVYSDDGNDNDDAGPWNTTKFVGAYSTPMGPAWTPIFLLAGDAIETIMYPWDQSLARVTVPDGLALVTFSQVNFTGQCAVWTTDADINASTWGTTIRSMKAMYASQSTTCPTRDAVVVVPTPSPQVSVASTSGATDGHLETYLIVASAVGIFFVVGVLVLWRRRVAANAKDKLQDGTHTTTTATTTTTTSTVTQYVSLRWRDLDMVRLDTLPLPLTHLVATGASGSVYLGTFLDKPVVIKSFPSGRLPSDVDVQALIDEIDFMRTLHCSKIVTLEGAAWTHPSNLQAVIEYMNLGDLRRFLATTTHATFTWPKKLECALSVVEALFYLHSQNMLHRDLKSRNVLLDSTKGTKLGDFGASKEIIYGDTLTANVGTYRWMAPEMLLFKPYSSPVDIFSFGVLLSELSTHQVPYADVMGMDGCALSDEVVARRVIHDDLRPSFRPTCPAWFVTLATECMASDAGTRPTAVQVMYTLQAQIRQLASG
ncbi:Aste57867_9884 [Aphanomyces stellatus]|uniref:Aste57867_9884 protein n=1 Tax=Aphanomyces stellatus TaxID=120398 RepID=A0A485KP18_9STRA|nr:hypothetical protein As57867_009845 [Aphanomyces stellatus]VFT86763.1 Aste57867_9884 [Aphanomyces stellatus]